MEGFKIGPDVSVAADVRDKLLVAKPSVEN